ncbi:MAG TPA: alpha/beta hydrolase [Limnobacter sp.]|nr:alpha/beta hydrolase [Limnobacter sp.]
MPSIQASVVNQISKLALRNYKGEAPGFVKRFRLVTGISNLVGPVPSGVKRMKGQLGGVQGEWLIPQNAQGSLLYIHGGAFVAGGPPMYRPFCGAIAKALKLRVFSVDYRMAPEHPFPAPYDDCMAAFDALVKDTPTGQPILVAGDSAGGNLSMCVVQHAAKKKLPLHGALLISPATDMRRLSPTIEGNAKTDSMLSPLILKLAAETYLNGHDPADPKASPLLGAVKNLPPILITASDDECLLGDGAQLHEKIQAAGGASELLTRPGMPHIWPVMTTMLPEAKEDLVKILNFFRAAMAAA